MIRFTQTELRHIFISILVLAFAVSGLNPYRLAAFSLPLALGFIAHELAHKFAAARYGYFAVYRMWAMGLLLALLVGLASRGRVLIAAPGAVVILTAYFTRRESGLIGLVGPLTNLAVAACFFPLRYFGGFISDIGNFGIFINLWLAFFNLLPVPPLDGYRTASWNKKIWLITFLPIMATIVLFV
jgi:Zn-dependent protease